MDGRTDKETDKRQTIMVLVVTNDIYLLLLQVQASLANLGVPVVPVVMQSLLVQLDQNQHVVQEHQMDLENHERESLLSLQPLLVVLVDLLVLKTVSVSL